MSEKEWTKLAGWAGLASFALFVCGLGTEAAAGPPPAFADNAALLSHLRDHSTVFISAGLLISLSLMIELILVLGIRDLVRSAGAAWASVGDLFLLFYVVAYPIGLVASGLLIAATTEAISKGDVSTIRALWGGGFSLLGAVAFLPLILGSITYAVAVQRTGVLPRWTAWVAWIAALGAAAAVPSAFGGTGFYSQLGPAPALLQGVPGLAWLLVASISMVRLRTAASPSRIRA
jgi:hypothetical protein